MTLPVIINPLPFTLTNGTVADAVKVMADFSAIVVDVNNNSANAAMFPGGVLAPQYGGSGNAGTYTQNAALVADGSGNLVSSPVSIDATTGAISGFRATYNNQVGTTYTMQAGDAGKVVTHNNGSGITVTLPATFPIGFTIEGVQLGAGQVTYAAGAGATLVNRQTQFKIAGQYGQVVLKVVANSGGTAAVWNLAGDTSA